MRYTLIAVALSILLTPTLGADLQAETPQEETLDETSRRELESRQLLRLIREAPPAPTTGGTLFSETFSRALEQQSLIRYDLATGEITELPPGQSSISGPLPSPSSRVPSKEPIPAWDALNHEFDVPWAEEPAEGMDSSFDAPTNGITSCSPPSPNLATLTFPWTTTYKLVMRFNVGGTDFFYQCSASSMAPFHLLTAGHCIYNRDPNRDGSTADRKFADEVWAWAAQTDNVNPFMGGPSPEDRPYGFAKAVSVTTYTGWSNSGDFNHDIGYITLDRRDGNHTGWMGREANATTTTLNFNGYPAETPFVPVGEIRQYPGSDPGNVTSYTTFRINMCAFVYGGHSGGPVWRFDGTDRFTQGVNSTSDRMGSAAATRIDSSKLNDITTLIADDESNLPPTARPDLAEYFFTNVDDRKDLLTNTVTPGGNIQVEYNVLNAGFAATGGVTVDFYLSTNNIISTLDTFIASRSLASLDAFTFVNPTTTLTVPAGIAPGTYFVGWILSGTVPEYSGDLDCTGSPCTNVAVIADETLTVESCTPDTWEPDGSSGQANGIASGLQQTHSICPAGDEDWVTFSLGATSAIVLQTSGSAGDTRMWLYDSNLSQIEFDDDDGNGLFSFIDRTCGVDSLPAGTYFVQIDEFGDNDEIESYDLDLTVSGCGGGCPADLVLANQTLTGTQTLEASSTATLGPNLTVNGTNIEINAPLVTIVSGTRIGGAFSAGTNPSCP